MQQNKESILSEQLKVKFLSKEITNNLCPNKSFDFKRKLISRVRKQRLLYDHRHDQFSNIEAKQEVWEKIAKNLEANVENCKNTWSDLRYQYQRYVRRLRNYLRFGNKNRAHKRPIMAFEVEMMFLYRFISDKSLCRLPFGKINNNARDSDDDIVILDDDPVVIILDDEDKNQFEAAEFQLTTEMRKLIDVVKNYTELYDSASRYFYDYRRKGIIWNGIANEMGDKATKLMKTWILIQTRYEWEIWHNKKPISENEKDIRHVMKFLLPYINNNPNTVYKQSLFLKLGWQEPIDHFKNIFNLLVLLKRYLNVVNETEKQISMLKNHNYVKVWSELSKSRTHSPGEFETTWLLLRFFYWELMHMRKHSYQLQDKWYFENIITDLYANAQLAETVILPVPIAMPLTKATPIVSVPTTATTSTSKPSNTSTKTPTITIKPISALTNAFEPKRMLLPKIISAKSLATSKVTSANATKGLQIMPCVPPVSLNGLPTISNACSLPSTSKTNSQVCLIPSPRTQTQQTQQPPSTPQVSGTPSSTGLAQPKITNMKTMGTIPVPLTQTQQTHQTPSTPQVSATQSSTGLAQPIITNMNTMGTIPSPRIQTLQTQQTPSTPQVSATQSSTGFAQPKITNVKTIGTNAPNVTTSPNSFTAKCPTAITIIPSNNLNTTNKNVTVQMKAVAATPSIPVVEIPKIPAKIVPTESSMLPNSNSEKHVLNSNEIMIELIYSSTGSYLIAHGPAMPSKISLSMTETAAFIRTVMSIPLIHNPQYLQSSRVHAFWVVVSTKFNIPAHICRALWNFLSDNFNHFPKISPMEELMAPFAMDIRHAWHEGNVLFKKFYSTVSEKGWLIFENKFPALLENIGQMPVLYQDLLRTTISKPQDPPTNTEMIWQSISKTFHIAQAEEVWNAFKSVFWQYMTEIELGWLNYWPQRLWKSFAKLEFLISQRYTKFEPFYYIVRNQFRIEIERCKKLQEVMIVKPSEASYTAPATSITAYEIDAYNLLAAIRRNSDIYMSKDAQMKENSWLRVANEMNTTVAACRLCFQRAIKNYRKYMIRDPANRCRLNHRYYKNMHVIFRAIKSSQKISVKSASELNQSGTDPFDPCDVIFPDRMIFDISVDTASPELVVKNWMYGVGNCSAPIQNSSRNKLYNIFQEYSKFAKKS